MNYLVDANVLSEATKPAPDAKVVAWLRQNEREITVDPITWVRSGSGSTFCPPEDAAGDWNAGSTRV